MFVRRGFDWVCYGEFSGWKLLPRYDGSPPSGDDFIPYDGDLNMLDGPKDRNLVHAFRCGMLLHGVDLAGLGGMTTMAHSEADVEDTVAAVGRRVDLEHGAGARGRGDDLVDVDGVSAAALDLAPRRVADRVDERVLDRGHDP